MCAVPQPCRTCRVLVPASCTARTRGLSQPAPGGAHRCTCAIRVPASGVPRALRAVWHRRRRPGGGLRQPAGQLASPDAQGPRLRGSAAAARATSRAVRLKAECHRGGRERGGLGRGRAGPKTSRRDTAQRRRAHEHDDHLRAPNSRGRRSWSRPAGLVRV